MIEKICLDKTRKPSYLREENENLILSHASGLNSVSEVGGIILRMLNNEKSFCEIIQEITNQYEVSYDRIKYDINGFINCIKDLDIISENKANDYFNELDKL